MQRNTRYLLIGITAFFLLLTVVKSFYFTKKYGGTDLRCRVIGSRLIGTPYSPYYYKWKPADGEFYLNPNDRNYMKVNGNSVTPAVLVVMYPLSLLPYSQVRLCWTILQLLAAAGIILLLFKDKNPADRFLLAAPVILGLICTDVWLYNIERGQMYIFYALLLALMYRFYISNRRNGHFISGFIGGLFIFFRPFAILLGLGFLLHGKKKWIWGAMTGFITGLLIFVLPLTKDWQDYSSAMQEYINRYTGVTHYDMSMAETAKPEVVEGQTNLSYFHYFHIGRLDTVHLFLKRFGIYITANQSLSMFAIVAAVFSWLFFRQRKTNSSPGSVFLFGFLLFILSEFFVPTPLASYNLIVWIFPLTIIYLQNRNNHFLLIVLATSVLLLHYFPFNFPYQEVLAEICFLLLTAFVLFFPVTVKKLQNGNSRVQ